MLTATATEAWRGFPELLARVEHDGETVVVTRDGRDVARLSPAHTQERNYTVARFREVLQKLPRLDDDYARDVAEATTHLTQPEDLWGDS